MGHANVLILLLRETHSSFRYQNMSTYSQCGWHSVYCSRSCCVHSSASSIDQIPLKAPADTAPVRLLQGLFRSKFDGFNTNANPIFWHLRSWPLRNRKIITKIVAFLYPNHDRVRHTIRVHCPSLGSFLVWLKRGVWTSWIPNFSSKAGVIFAPPGSATAPEEVREKKQGPKELHQLSSCLKEVVEVVELRSHWVAMVDSRLRYGPRWFFKKPGNLWSHEFGYRPRSRLTGI